MKKLFSLLIMAFALSLTACNDNVRELQGDWVSEDSTTFYHFDDEHLWVGNTSDGEVTNMYGLRVRSITDSEVAYIATTIDTNTYLRDTIPITIWNNPIGNHYERNIIIGEKCKSVKMVKVRNSSNTNTDDEDFLWWMIASGMI